MKKACPRCIKIYEGEIRRCPECGEDLIEEPKPDEEPQPICVECGGRLVEMIGGGFQCEKCGFEF